MRTQNSPLITAVQSGTTQRCETMFHELFICACMVAMWLTTGSLNVNGQTHEIETSDHTANGYIFQEEIRSSAPHRIIQSPAANPLRNASSPYSHSTSGLPDNHSSVPPHGHSSTVKQVFDETLHTDGPLLRRLHEHKQPLQAKIPDATVEPQWKTPYAYGYFGASSKKHWIKSSGYRDTYKRWTKE